jgi:hypothetical protein
MDASTGLDCMRAHSGRVRRFTHLHTYIRFQGENFWDRSEKPENLQINLLPLFLAHRIFHPTFVR